MGKMEDIELEVGEPIKIANGEHRGEVKDYEIREAKNKLGEIIHYVDYLVTCEDVKMSDGKPFELTYGAPLPKQLTKANKLGRTFEACGFPIVKRNKYKVSQLVGTHVKYITKNIPNVELGVEFANILDVLEKA